MIISAPADYRDAARRLLPRFLFDYLDGGAVTETTLRQNEIALQQVALRQRVLQGIGAPTLATHILGQDWAMPIALAPIGAAGLYARRGEVQAARAARARKIPFTLSTVSVCAIEEVARDAGGTIWSQLYVLKDRGYMQNALDRAWDAGMRTLVFTVDMPTPGSRYRDHRSGMSGPYATLRQVLQALAHPRWAIDVAVRGRPLSFGNIEAYTKRTMRMTDYIGFLAANFDPSVAWNDLEWIRDAWRGTLVIKGLLDVGDALDAKRLGADAIVVSNHGGRQLDGALPTAAALPAIADAVADDLTILADGGIRSGLDVVRMLALGAKAVLIGRAYMYALATGGERAVTHLLDLFEADMKVTLTLIGANSPAAVTREALATLQGTMRL